MRLRHTLLVAPLVVLSAACHYYEHRVDHAQVAYEQGRYADVDTWLDLLDAHVGEMDTHLETRYYYLRGMSELRLGHRDEALHHLALAKEVPGGPATLTPEEQAMLESTYTELKPTTATFHANPAPQAAALDGEAPPVRVTATIAPAPAPTPTPDSPRNGRSTNPR